MKVPTKQPASTQATKAPKKVAGGKTDKKITILKIVSKNRFFCTYAGFHSLHPVHREEKTWP